MRLIPSSLILFCLHCATPPMSLTGVDVDRACADGEVLAIRVQGDGLSPVVTGILEEQPKVAMPRLWWEAQSGLAAGSAPPHEGPVAISSAQMRWLSDSALEVLVADELEPGLWDLVVEAADGRQDRISGALLVLGEPRLDGAAPEDICHEAGTVGLRLSGQGLMRWQGESPVVEIDGQAALVTGAEGCSPLAGGRQGEVCTGLSLEVEPGLWALGEVDLLLSHPPDLECPLSARAELEVLQAPTVEAVAPGSLCTSGGELSVEGGPFSEGIRAWAGELELALVRVDPTELRLSLPEGLEPGALEILLEDPGGCSAALPTVQIFPPPSIWRVDPPVVWEGAAMELSAWMQDLNSPVTELWLTGPDGLRVEVEWSTSADDIEEVDFLVPAGLSPGEWQVEVAVEEGCGGGAAGTFEVSDQIAVSVSEVEPPFAWTWTHSPVLIHGEDPLPEGLSGFEDPPRAWLIGAGGRSAALLGLRWRSPDLLSAVIPAELPPGSYDLLVLNPSGQLGLLSRAVDITSEAPPTLESVSPPGLANSGAPELWLEGTNFRDPTVGVICDESGAEVRLEAEVLSWSWSSIQAELSTSSISEAVCLVEVTNGDGTWSRWAALSITNPAQNLFPWEEGPELVQARRAPAAAAGRVSSTSRYVYAIGGDEGDPSSARTSIEVASIGVYGDLGAWSLLPTELPRPRSLAAALPIGRFIYLVGGDEGEGPVDSVLRARILDPLDAPFIEGAELDMDGGTLGGGLWRWQVAALFPADDPSNPGGESLGGEALSLELPETEGLAVELSWSAVEGASGYRVYRSSPDDLTNLQWIADVSDTSLIDTGLTADPALNPLLEGSLGQWAPMPELMVPRASPCIAAAPDPFPDPNRVHLYVAGGETSDGSYLDSVEVLDITLVSEDEQWAGSWKDAGVQLSEARARCGAGGLSTSLHSAIPEDESWLVVVAGAGERGATGAVDAGQVQSGGTIADWQTSRSMSADRAGFAFAHASNFLYAFGGSNDAPSATGTSAELRVGLVPQLRNWNSLGTSLSAARHLPGSAQESAVIIVLGGETPSAGASTSTDWTRY